MSDKKICLIVEGGGFKTGFTAGILDTFMISKYNPFNFFIGISGGAIACSYFLSNQYRQHLDAIKFLVGNDEFTKVSRIFDSNGYMNIEMIKDVARNHIQFDIKEAIERTKNAELYFVGTEFKTGLPSYIQPNKNNWLDLLIASSALPFVTKGKHELNDVNYFDGGFGDPLPVEWAYKKGASKVLIIRTMPENMEYSMTLMDLFGRYYYNDIPHLKESFENYHNRYNKALDFISSPPTDLEIIQIAPKKELKSTTLSFSHESIMKDYRYGLDVGLRYLNEHMEKASS